MDTFIHIGTANTEGQVCYGKEIHFGTPDPPGLRIWHDGEMAMFDTGDMGGWEFFAMAIFKMLDGDTEFLRSRLTERKKVE